jgi:hypothetical protein
VFLLLRRDHAFLFYELKQVRTGQDDGGEMRVSRREQARGAHGRFQSQPLGDQAPQLLTAIPQIVKRHYVIITLWINERLFSNESDRVCQALRASNCVQPGEGVPSQTTSLQESIVEFDYNCSEGILRANLTSITISCQWDKRAIVLPERAASSEPVAVI